MIRVICPQEERHHSRLALAYVTRALQEEEETDLRKTRGKLQQQLWESRFYNVSTVYGVLRPCEKANHYRINTELKVFFVVVVVFLFFFCRESQANNPAHRESHSPLQGRWTLSGSAGARSPGARPPGCRGVLLQGRPGPGLSVRADPPPHLAPDLPELWGSRQRRSGPAQQQPSVLRGREGHPAPAWLLVRSAALPVLNWIPQRDLAPEADGKAAKRTEPGRAHAAQGHLGEFNNIFHIFISLQRTLCVVVFLFCEPHCPFHPLLCRCRPRKQSSGWTRGRSVRFVRQTLQSQSLPWVTTVSWCTQAALDPARPIYCLFMQICLCTLENHIHFWLDKCLLPTPPFLQSRLYHLSKRCIRIQFMELGPATFLN